MRVKYVRKADGDDFEESINDAISKLEKEGNEIIDIKMSIDHEDHSYYTHEVLIMYYTKAESRDKKIDNVLSE